MSRYLSIECEWCDQPVAADPVERRTWARIQINAAGRTATRLWDRDAQAERQSIYVPAFSLARWIAANWWALLYEPARADRIPTAENSTDPEQLAWLRRHCLRFADSGLMLPRLNFYSDGRGVVAEWFADEPDAFPHMPGQFVGADRVHLPVDEVQIALREFLAGVVARLNGLGHAEAVQLKNNWQSISEADPDESAFCRSAGKIGLDPYCLSDWPLQLAELLESGLGSDSDRPIASDFLEATEPDTAVELWNWVEKTHTDFDLRQSPAIASLPSATSRNPVTNGYQLAQELRKILAFPASAPLKSVADAAQALKIGPLVFEPHNHLCSPTVLGAVGWRGGREPVLAAPKPLRETTMRFLEARSLYHAAFACRSGPRLVTDARTWNQQASRTFAAELLAPQAGLRARFNRVTWARDPEGFEKKLADDYNVSTKVVAHQPENAGLNLSEA